MYKFGCVSFLTEVKKRNAVVIREGSNLFDTPEATNSHLAHREKTPGQWTLYRTSFFIF